MATYSSKESSAARLSYASARGAERRVTSAVTPLSLGGGRGASVPLREIAPGAALVSAQTLPVLATAGDVRELVRLLKHKSSGMSVVAAMGSEQKRIFDPRKIAAYEFWGIIIRDGERLRLTALGADMARCLEPEARAYRTVLDRTVFYRTVLEWVFRQGLELVTHLDVAAYWQEHYPEATDEQDEKTAEASVVCFFHLCQAAELGTMTIGKRGQPARLHVARTELSEYMQANRPTQIQPTKQTPETRDEAGPTSESHGRLLISHGQRAEIVEQVRVTLELAGIESEIVERREAVSTGGPIAEHILKAMRRADRAVIVVSSEDCQGAATGNACLRQDVLVEIGAAFVFYDGRVLLLWDEAVPVPSNLRNLCRCRFAAGKLTWEDGVSLMKAMREILRK